MGNTEITIQSVLSRLQATMDELNADAEALRNSSTAISGEIGSVLVDLQFQDRTSQILGHVRDSLLRSESMLNEIRAQGGTDRHKDMMQIDEVLEHMLREYTTQEEVRMHKGEAGAAQTQTASELTFF